MDNLSVCIQICLFIFSPLCYFCPNPGVGFVAYLDHAFSNWVLYLCSPDILLRCI